MNETTPIFYNRKKQKVSIQNTSATSRKKKLKNNNTKQICTPKTIDGFFFRGF